MLACVRWVKACLSIRGAASIPRTTMTVYSIHLWIDGHHDDDDDGHEDQVFDYRHEDRRRRRNGAGEVVLLSVLSGSAWLKVARTTVAS